MTEMWGVVALRLANANLLPLDFDFYGESVKGFLDDLDRSTHLSEHVELAGLQKQIDAFEEAGRAVNQAARRVVANGNGNAAALDQVNQTLMQVERNWCNPAGIPGRPWFKHTIYATRFTYAHLELPGLTEAAEAGDWARAKEQAAILSDAMAKNTKALQTALDALNTLGGAEKQ
jgi:N-acetylated-alpha-linked acidic dipeptidase